MKRLIAALTLALLAGLLPGTTAAQSLNCWTVGSMTSCFGPGISGWSGTLGNWTTGSWDYTPSTSSGMIYIPNRGSSSAPSGDLTGMIYIPNRGSSSSYYPAGYYPSTYRTNFSGYQWSPSNWTWNVWPGWGW
jgi:hypothetical protein